MNRELDIDRQSGPSVAPGHQPEREIAPLVRQPEIEPFTARSYEAQRSRPGRPLPDRAREHDMNAEEREPRIDRSKARDRLTGGVSERDATLLADIGRFRIVRADDLRLAYFHGSERSLSEALAKLRDAGLIEDHLLNRRRGQNGPSASTRIVVLTHMGKRVAEARSPYSREQRLYAGLVKPREALHDSNLYRLFQVHATKLVRDGSSVRRVVLDFELKREYLRELRRRERRVPGASDDQLKNEAAACLNLAVVEGKVQFPDLRLEYENSLGQRSKVDLELATADYRQTGLAAKARAGFTLYAAPGDEGRLGAIPLDDHDLVGGILSF